MFKCEHHADMKNYCIPNLKNACDVLNLISESSTGIPLKTISSSLSIPHTTALRITQTLRQADYIAQKDDHTYVLGSAVVQLGIKALDNIDIRGYARPVLLELACDTNESAHLAMLNGTKSMLVEVADSPHPIRIAARPGTLVDLHPSSTGKIFLAYSIKDPEIFCSKLDLHVHTPNTHNTVAKVLKGIEETRKRGYAVDDEEYASGIRCIAVPIMNAFGKTVDALGITASTATLTKARIPRVAERVRKAANEISQKLGYAG